MGDFVLKTGGRNIQHTWKCHAVLERDRNASIINVNYGTACGSELDESLNRRNGKLKGVKCPVPICMAVIPSMLRETGGGNTKPDRH